MWKSPDNPIQSTLNTQTSLPLCLSSHIIPAQNKRIKFTGCEWALIIPFNLHWIPLPPYHCALLHTPPGLNDIPSGKESRRCLVHRAGRVLRWTLRRRCFPRVDVDLLVAFALTTELSSWLSRSKVIKNGKIIHRCMYIYFMLLALYAIVWLPTRIPHLHVWIYIRELTKYCQQWSDFFPPNFFVMASCNNNNKKQKLSENGHLIIVTKKDACMHKGKIHKYPRFNSCKKKIKHWRNKEKVILGN